MAWTDRLREAAYNSPSGQRFVFQYEDVSERFDKKTSSFDFPDADGTYVQDTGSTSRRYPLNIIFWGADYDETARSFMDALAERGPGVLEHPIYGQVDVLPFGQIARRDDLKTAANQAVIEVTFWGTIGVVYPESQDDAAADTAQAVEDTNAAVADEFAEVSDLEGALEQATLREKFQSVVDNVESGLQAVADTRDDVARKFSEVKDSIDAGIDTLVAEPLSLAFQTAQLIQAPARAAASIQDRLQAYRDLADSIISGDGARTSNEFLSEDVTVSGAVSGSVVSALNTDFETRSEALQTAEEILDQFERANDWREGEYTRFGLIDTGGAYQQLQRTVALAAGYLVEISLNLAQERAIVLDRARTIIDLASELYGEVDARLDFIIATNELTGSEILELPAGKRVLYYE